MVNDTAIQPVILRYHSKHKEVLLFLPDNEANAGMIVCYAHIGQHGEASMAYYWETRPIHHAPACARAEGRDLLKEYRAICKDAGQTLKVVARDTPVFREARYGWIKKGKS